MKYIVIAEQCEYDLIKEFKQEGYPVIVTGVGGINVIRALKDLPRDSEIVNIGYCGSNKLPIGTMVLVDEVVTEHQIGFREPILACKYLDYSGCDRIANCYTSTDFVTKSDRMEYCVFDMELAFIRAMFDNVVALKVVSDNLDYEEYNGEIK